MGQRWPAAGSGALCLFLIQQLSDPFLFFLLQLWDVSAPAPAEGKDGKGRGKLSTQTKPTPIISVFHTKLHSLIKCTGFFDIKVNMITF